MQNTKSIVDWTAEQFAEEVFHEPVLGATLPENLTDYWLDRVLRAVETFWQGNEQVAEGSPEYSTCAATTTGAVVRLLMDKQGGSGTLEIPLDDLLKLIPYYLFELSAEMVARRTEIAIERPTLETILTNRAVSWGPQERRQ